MPRRAAALGYRFNRRYGLAAMLFRLTWAFARTSPVARRPRKLPKVVGRKHGREAAELAEETE